MNSNPLLLLFFCTVLLLMNSNTLLLLHFSTVLLLMNSQLLLLLFFCTVLLLMNSNPLLLLHFCTVLLLMYRQLLLLLFFCSPVACEPLHSPDSYLWKAIPYYCCVKSYLLHKSGSCWCMVIAIQQPDVPACTICTVQLIKCCSWWWTNDSPKRV